MTLPQLPDPEALEALAARVEQASEADRELADDVLFACGWQVNHDAEKIEEWRANPGTCEGEDGEDYPVTFADRMNWSCWYPPGNRPFYDSWIDGHYRPNPLASLDAAMSLVPEGLELTLHVDALGPYVQVRNDHGGVELSAFAKTLALALTAAHIAATAFFSAVGIVAGASLAVSIAEIYRRYVRGE